MTELNITAMTHDPGGPSYPTTHSAWTSKVPFGPMLGVDRLSLIIGEVIIHIWPFEVDKVKELADKLYKLVAEKEAMELKEESACGTL